MSLTILKYCTNSREEEAKQLVVVAGTQGSGCSCHSGQGSRECAGPRAAHNLQKLIYGDLFSLVRPHLPRVPMPLRTEDNAKHDQVWDNSDSHIAVVKDVCSLVLFK